MVLCAIKRYHSLSLKYDVDYCLIKGVYMYYNLDVRVCNKGVYLLGPLSHSSGFIAILHSASYYLPICFVVCSSIPIIAHCASMIQFTRGMQMGRRINLSRRNTSSKGFPALQVSIPLIVWTVRSADCYQHSGRFSEFGYTWKI